MKFFISFVTTVSVWVAFCAIGRIIGTEQWGMAYIMLYGFFAGGLSSVAGTLVAALFEE